MFVANSFAEQRQALPRAAYLDTETLEEAIAFGETQSPHPYLVRMPTWDRFNIAVYTPFVRVAFAAHVAKQRGQQLTIQQVPRWLMDPKIHVVVRWPHEEPTRVVPDGTLFNREMKVDQITVAPVWVVE